MRVHYVSLAVLSLSLPTIAFQAIGPESRKIALERKGLHHTNIRGRVVSPQDEPVPGVRVQLNAGGVRALPLAETFSGADGVFLFRNVNSAYPPDLRWYPPEQWLKGATVLVGESGEDVDAGTIRLQPDTVIRVTTELVGGPPLGPRDREPTVVLQSTGRFPSRIVAEQIGSSRVLRQIPFDDANIEVSLFTNRKAEVFRAPFHLERGRRADTNIGQITLSRQPASPEVVF